MIAAVLPVLVTGHALERAAQRFGPFSDVRIEQEVAAALRERRFSPEPPAGFRGYRENEVLYAWTPERHEGGRPLRCYVLRAGRSSFRVCTTLRAGEVRRREPKREWRYCHPCRSFGRQLPGEPCTICAHGA